MYKSESPQYHSSSLLSQAMVITDSSSLGTLTSLAAVRQVTGIGWSVRDSSKTNITAVEFKYLFIYLNVLDFFYFGQILTADPEEQTDPSLQEDSLHLQPPTPVPGTQLYCKHRFSPSLLNLGGHVTSSYTD